MPVTPDIVLVTGRELSHSDDETPKLAQALAARGIAAEIRAWQDDVDWAEPGLVVIRSAWDYVPRRRRFLDWASQVASMTRLVNPVSFLEWNSHKRYLLELADRGLPVVPTQLVRAGASTTERRAALAAFGAEIVVKPAVSAGARGALRSAAGSAEAAEHLEELVAHGEALVQPYLPEVTVDGELSVVVLGGQVSHAARKIPAPGDFRVQQHLGGRTEPYQPDADDAALALRALALTSELLGAQPGTYARVDVVHTAAGPMLMELELVEPFLFLDYAPGAVERFADVLAAELDRQSRRD